MSSPSDFFDVVEFDYDLEKKKFIDNLNFLKNMDVHEQTFYKKWYELQSYNSLISNSTLTKASVWNASDILDEKSTISEIEAMNPTIELVKTKADENHWLMLRLFCHTMEFSQTPGRFLKFLIHDGSPEKKYLGGISVSSDVIAITDRDNYIGWSSENRLKGNKRINNSSIGSCIMSTQPFGYNFLGGKLGACLVTTDVVRETWKSQYDAVLAGMTTTSLYGSFSMYNSLKWWYKCGTSAGKISIKPDDSVYEIWHHWIQKNKPAEYAKMMTQKEGVSGPVTGAKQRVISTVFSQLGIKASDYVHGFQRGTYYSSFYENTRDFLCDKITENELVMKPLFAGDKNLILEWWRPRAIERYKKLRSEGKLKSDVLYYNDMIGMEYNEAKERYLNEVGR
jgi:hypothetical protein